MAGVRAPKQWSLTKQETITSFEAWRQNLNYTLSLDQNFATFLVDGFTWNKKTNAAPLRGFENDGEGTPNARTAAQKVAHLDLMLGQIANYCPVISRNTIVKNSTSINGIWQAIRLHYGFQSTGAHFLDFNNIHLEPGERPEDLFQRLNSFVEDNLLLANGNIHHHGVVPEADEELSPTLENLIVLTWLRLIHRDLPSLVKQRYGTELRSQSLASLKPEISQALDSLLEEIHSSAEAKVLRAGYKTGSSVKPSSRFSTHKGNLGQRKTKMCILCKQAGRPSQHYLSSCMYLPEEDRSYMTKIRQLSNLDICENDNTDLTHLDQGDPVNNDTDLHDNQLVSSSRRVSTKQSPTLKTFYKQYPLTLTLDTGAEISMIKSSTAKFIGASISSSKQHALQADGVTPLEILGETHLLLSRNNHTLRLEALVVNDLDVDVLAGIPFMDFNDISIRPAKHQIMIGDSDTILYGSILPDSRESHVRRTQAYVLRATPVSTVVWPGDFIEVSIPSEVDQDGIFAIEPRTEKDKLVESWLQPHVTEAVGGKIRINNDTCEPQHLSKNEHFCQIRLTTEQSTVESTCTNHDVNTHIKPVVSNYSDSVQLDPDNILPQDIHKDFKQLLNQYDDVFSSDFKGYNGAVGPFQAFVNMGPVQPPQRKGRVPQYSRDNLVELQQQFDDLEKRGVFKRPEDIGVNVEYLNPSFLVKKSHGGHRLVTAFTDVGRYSKPQPSLMPDVDSILRQIAQWKYIIVTDLTSAFYQIPLSKASMKYCGVATPFRGVRVYTRTAMGMPGSETALEELMCRVLGDLLQEGCVAKLADDLYCGANSLEELLCHWQRVLDALRKSDLNLSPTKTVICPRTTTILGWIWSQGKLSASPHRIAVLSNCSRPETVRGLRSFIGAYKVLGRVLPKCSQLISPLESAITGLQSQDKLTWTDELCDSFSKAQKALAFNKSITLPKQSDQLWIVTDGSVGERGIGATLYIARDNKLSIAAFFSAKLRKHQITWLPCEIEALSIAAAVKHFSPYIIQSDQKVCLLTDSKPCVQAVEKLCRGEFSASPRVTSFLSIVSRYQVNVKHLAGSANLPSDFASRNAPECFEPKCQICSFIVRTEDSVVRAVCAQDVLDNLQRMPFTTRSAWLDVQSECQDLRRTHAHLKQGTRPSRKLTNLKDVKRYLNVVSISKDGLLVVRRFEPFSAPSELIVVPRNVLDGLVMALHIKLDHPSKHQLELVFKRHFYALDMSRVISYICDSCHLCASLKKVPEGLVQQSSESPPETVGISFAADVIKRNRQLILILRETVTSFTSACIIDNEKHDTLRDGLVQLAVGLHPLDGPPAIIRVDPAPGFVALREDSMLSRLHLNIEIGRVKNPNKNPVAEKAIFELENELLRQEPGGGIISKLQLSLAVARLNSRIRYSGLSARELWTQRSQFSNEQLPIQDRDTIIQQHELRQKNHTYSEKSKLGLKSQRNDEDVVVGDLVYLYRDGNKSQARSRYLVVSVDGDWCYVKKFSGNQLRASSYKIKLSECYRVPYRIQSKSSITDQDDLSDEEDVNKNVVCSDIDLQREYTDTVVPSHSIPKDNVVLSEPISDITPDIHLSEPNNTPLVPDTPDEIQGPSRPQRNRKQPKYLEDYIM